MSFLHAGLLGLGALFTVPLIIHLLNRRRYKRVQWAAMDFLLKAYKQNRRRLRLESLLLLLLRCAIPVLLAFAVARPRLHSDLVPAASQGPHHVFVVDRSYSMGYRSAGGSRPFDRMKRLVTTLLDRIALRQDEKVSLVYLGVDVSTPVRGDLDVSRARRALARLDAPTDGRADLRAGIEAARELVRQETEPARIYVLSDFQEITLQSDAMRRQTASGGPEEAPVDPAGRKADPLQELRDLLQDLIDDQSAEVVLFPLAPRGATSNTQVVALHLDPENAVASVRSRVRVDLMRRAPGPRDTLVKLRLDGGNEQTRRVRLRPDEPAEAVFSIRFLQEGMHAITVEIDEDGLPVDDQRRLVTRVRDQIHVLLVEGRDTSQNDEILTNSYLYRYLLDPTQGEGEDELRTFRTRVVDEDRFQSDPSFFQNQDVIALFDVRAPRPDVAARLVRFVEQGGGLLIVPGPNSLPNQYNVQLFGVGGEGGPLPLRLLEVAGYKGQLGTGKGVQLPARYATPAVVAEKHPVLQDFRSRELRDFLELMPVYRWWGTSQIDAPEATTVVLGLAGAAEQDRPALIASRRFGQGESMLLTSNVSLRPDRWNRLETFDQVSFPLVHSIFHHLAREPKESLNRLVGEPLTTWVADRPSALYMNRPGDRGRVPLPLPRADVRSDRRSGWGTPPFEDTRHAGIYRLGIEFAEKTKSATEILFAVNPDPEEGVLRYVSADTLARELPGVQIREDLAVEVGTTIEAGSSELGRWFLLLALLAALAECVLASFVGGRRR